MSSDSQNNNALFYVNLSRVVHVFVFDKYLDNKFFNYFCYAILFNKIYLFNFLHLMILQLLFYSQCHQLRELLEQVYSYLRIMFVNSEQLSANNCNFSGCLVYAVIKLELEFFKIMLIASNVLVFILAIIFQAALKSTISFKHIFLFALLFIVLQLRVAHLSICF